jgi:phosphatidate cytidylyltransferase
MAYFTGRTLGGPKLWPRVSPKKTWSGFVGGVVSGAVAASAVGIAFGLKQSLATFVLYIVLAVASQGGDLFESALKRRFGTKDASHLIPGHGGVMDRLDGFIAAALVALAVAAIRDPEHLGAGLLLW